MNLSPLTLALPGTRQRFHASPFVVLPPRFKEMPSVLWMLPYMRIRPLYSVHDFRLYYAEQDAEVDAAVQELATASLPEKREDAPRGYVLPPLVDAFMLIRAGGELLRCDTTPMPTDYFGILTLTREELALLDGVDEQDPQQRAASFYVDTYGRCTVHVFACREAAEAAMDANPLTPENWRDKPIGKELCTLPLRSNTQDEHTSFAIEGAAARALTHAWFSLIRRTPNAATFTDLVQGVLPLLAP